MAAKTNRYGDQPREALGLGISPTEATGSSFSGMRPDSASGSGANPYPKDRDIFPGRIGTFPHDGGTLRLVKYLSTGVWSGRNRKRRLQGS